MAATECVPVGIILMNLHDSRATLLLVPLLGLQYILTPFRPPSGHPWERVYEALSAFTASFQVTISTFLFLYFYYLLPVITPRTFFLCL